MNLNQWATKILKDPLLTQMGHAENPPDDLGLGWLYYSLARVYKPKMAVVIGSYRGFVPMMIGRAMMDNHTQPSKVILIDPSFVDDFWYEPAKFQAHFKKYGVTNIEHFLLTSERFNKIKNFISPKVDMLFIDGYHSAEYAKYDFEMFHKSMTPQGITLFHDSIDISTSIIYGKKSAYKVNVVDYINQLRLDPKLQVFDIPVGNGVTLVRKRGYPEKFFGHKRKITYIKK